MKIIGIYHILNKINGKFYIGSSINCLQRIYTHKTLLRKNSHHSIILQNSWNKYGESNFEFKLLETCETRVLKHLEQHYINKLKPYYNISQDVFSFNKGVKRKQTEYTKLKISCSQKGRSKSKISIEKMKETKRLNPQIHSVETKLKMSEAHKGKKYTLGRIISEEEKSSRRLVFREKRGKKIFAIDKNNNVIYKFNSISEGANFLKCRVSQICAVLSGSRKTFKKLEWKYEI